jgi:hypothetical protein
MIMTVVCNVAAVVLFFIAGGFVGYGNPGTSSMQMGLASCGFAIAGGLALVAGAIYGKRGTSSPERKNSAED